LILDFLSGVCRPTERKRKDAASTSRDERTTARCGDLAIKAREFAEEALMSAPLLILLAARILAPALLALACPGHSL
jgi:hypothetical protein